MVAITEEVMTIACFDNVLARENSIAVESTRDASDSQSRASKLIKIRARTSLLGSGIAKQLLPKMIKNFIRNSVKVALGRI